jgi:hypothetical protein
VARNRWSRAVEAQEFLDENGPVARSVPEVAEEGGFAVSNRPAELLTLVKEGYLSDKPRLLLAALEEILLAAGLPSLIPVSCEENDRTVRFFFSGPVPDLALYLERETGAEKVAGNAAEGSEWTGMSLSDLIAGGSRKAGSQGLGGTVTLRHLRDGLEIGLFDPAAHRCFRQLAPLPGTAAMNGLAEVFPAKPPAGLPDRGETNEPETGGAAAGSFRELSQSGVAPDAFETEDIYYLYGPVAVARVPDGIAPPRPDPEKLSGEPDGESSAGSSLPVALPQKLETHFFPLGAIYGEAEQPEGWAYFHLALENMHHLLLVAQEGDEDACTALNSVVLQLAAVCPPAELSLYLIDRPLAPSSGAEIEELVQEQDLSEEVAGKLAGQVADNRACFQLLVGLPQVRAVQLAEGYNGQGLAWRAGVEKLLEELYRELLRRKLAQAVTLTRNNPAIGLVLYDLAATFCLVPDKLSHLLAEGPGVGLYVLATTGYPAMLGEPRLPAALSDAASAAQLEKGLSYFKTLGVFSAPDQETSRKVWGDEEAFNLEGDGEMLLRCAGRIVSLRAFATDPLYLRECLSQLEELYPLPGSKGAAPVSPGENITGEPEKIARSPWLEEEVAVSNRAAAAGSALYPGLSPLETMAPKPGSSGNPAGFAGEGSGSPENSGPAAGEEETAGGGISGYIYEAGAGAEDPASPPDTEVLQTVAVEDPLATLADAEIRERWQGVRRECYRAGLVQLTLCIRLLHGYTAGLCLTPPLDRLNGSFRPLDLAAIFHLMNEAGLNFRALARAGLMEEGLAAELDGRGDKGPELPEEAAVQRVFYEMVCGSEKLNLIKENSSEPAGRFLQGNEQELLAYLALNPGISKVRAITDLGLDECASPERALSNRLSRLRRTLQQISSHFLALSLEGVAETELNFLEDTTCSSNLSFSHERVYVDYLHFEKVLKQGLVLPVNSAGRVERFEEAYRLAQVPVAEACDETLLLLGTYGNRLRWVETLENHYRQPLLQEWYNLNMELGKHYVRVKGLEKAEVYYRQAALARPDWDEPVLALMQLYYREGKGEELVRCYNLYRQALEEIGGSPLDTVEALYHSFTGDRGLSRSDSGFDKAAEGAVLRG